jgi:ABC-type Zn uptake system ZnuABC Zn-binding protein ZnuA
MNKRQKIFVTGVIMLVLTSAVAAAYYFVLQEETEIGKLKVVATFYRLAFFAKQIGGEEVSIKQLIPDNTEAHDWQPSPSDILAVDDADVILYTIVHPLNTGSKTT